MNAEIYSLRKKKKDSVAIKNALPDIITGLYSKNIRLLYKTELDYSYRKILECLEQTSSGSDEIDTVFIINGLGKTDCNPVMQAFDKICDMVDPVGTETDTDIDSDTVDISEIVNSNGAMPKKAKSDKKAEKERLKNRVLQLYSLGEMGNGYSACFTEYNNMRLVALPRSEYSGITTKAMIDLAVERLENSSLVPDIDESEKTINGYAFFKYKKVNNSIFNWRNYIPVKGDGGGEVARKIVFMAAALTVIITAGMIINEKLINPTLVEGEFNDLRNLYHGSDIDTSQIKVSSDIEGEKIDDSILPSFRSLISINKEVQGWIYIPNTTYIDYPVLYSKDDGPGYQKYLFRDYAGNYSAYGCIFLDYRSSSGTESKNVILHGHNMNNGMMFAQICDYKGLDFYKSTPTFTFNSRTEENEWVVFAVFPTNTLSEHGTFFNYLRGDFASDSEFMNFVYQCRARSLINTPVTVNEDDQIITLSTCSYEYKDFRTVVMARKVRPGEKANGFSFNTSNAYYASNPLKPAVYYRDNGGTPPSVGTFEDALKASGVYWYDGDGVLNGTPADPGMFFINDNPDPNDVASSKPSSSKPASSSDGTTNSGNSSSHASSSVGSTSSTGSSGNNTSSSSSEATSSVPDDTSSATQSEPASSAPAETPSEAVTSETPSVASAEPEPTPPGEDTTSGANIVPDNPTP